MNKVVLLKNIDRWISDEFFSLENMDSYSRGKLDGMNVLRKKIKEES